MRSRLAKLLLTALATTLWLLASAALAEPGQEEKEAKPMRPRAAAPVSVQACEGASEGDECSFTRGKLESSGTCMSRRGTLRCVSRRHRQPAQAGPGSDKRGGMKDETKPATPEAPSPE
jgi:hypothetical protein